MEENKVRAAIGKFVKVVNAINVPSTISEEKDYINGDILFIVGKSHEHGYYFKNSTTEDTPGGNEIYFMNDVSSFNEDAICKRKIFANEYVVIEEDRDLNVPELAKVQMDFLKICSEENAKNDAIKIKYYENVKKYCEFVASNFKNFTDFFNANGKYEICGYLKLTEKLEINVCLKGNKKDYIGQVCLDYSKERVLGFYMGYGGNNSLRKKHEEKVVSIITNMFNEFVAAQPK